jgi:hypothetical protein
MAESNWRGIAAACLLAAALMLSGCAAQKRERERAEDLADVLAWFPGHYDNLAQAEHDEKTGVHTPHDRVAILIIPVQTPRLGHHLFYAQEMAADDPKRVLSERMFSFDIDEERGIIGLMYNFAEPRRWRDGQLNPSIFTIVMAEDVAPVGCELIWKRSGEQFVANHDTKHCHRAGGSATSGPDATLSAEALTLSGYEFRKSGS